MSTKPTARANAYAGQRVTPQGHAVEVFYIDGDEAKRQNAAPPYDAGGPRILSGWYYENPDGDVLGPFTSSARAYADACGKPEGWDARPNHHRKRKEATA